MLADDDIVLLPIGALKTNTYIYTDKISKNHYAVILPVSSSDMN